jgi:predicted amidohydrolase YtcJ
MQPDLVLYGGIIRTLNPREPIVSALAIWRGQIVALGNDELRHTLSEDGEALNLHGRLVLPGFVDSHIHFVEHALRRQRVDLTGTRSLDEALERVRRATETTPAGDWILGGGWDRNLWPVPSFPDRRSLDEISRLHPIALDSKDVHTLWVSSMALQRAGITAGTAEPAGGRIGRDPDGEPDGILSEIPAKQLVWDAVEPPSPGALRDAITEATRDAWRAGMTGIHDCEDARAFEAFGELRERGELGLRVLMHLDVNNLEAAIQSGIRSGLGDAWLRVGAVKIFMDGALGSRTAWMREPYLEEPRNRGIPVISRGRLDELLRLALPNGVDVAIHAIGDAANRTVLDALESALALPGLPHGLRPRVEHAQILSPQDVPRFGRLGVLASVQPQHATADYEMVERYWGPEKGQGAYPFRSLLESGARLAFGSDCPVEPCEPLATLYAAVTRRRANGAPGASGWHPDERLTVAQALQAHITEPAWAAGEEELKGTLGVGKLADLVMLSRDIVTQPPERLLDTRVDATVIDGKMVYRSPDWAAARPGRSTRSAE